MPGPVDRAVMIMVTPTLIWANATSATATCVYTQLATSPHMPPTVAPNNGTINLRNMPSNSKYTNKTYLSFILDNTQLLDSTGWPIGGRWAFDNEGTPPSLGGCWFCATYPQTGSPNFTPITIPGMNAGRMGSGPDSNVYVYFNPDGTPRGNPITVQFCLGLIVFSSIGNYYITIDPQVQGSGTGIHPLGDDQAETGSYE